MPIPLIATCAIAAFAAAGVVIRPFRLPEAVWAVIAAVLLVVFGLLPPSGAWSGILKGTDVYLFLIGMMLIAEIAREEQLFDWLAAIATRMARGSPIRLFALIYIVGTVVTAFLSNDATAVVLTPAVAAAARTAKVKDPLPYLLICALIANAASFVFPISNPANLVIYGHAIPPLLEWLPQYLLPSAAAILVTFVVLLWTQRAALKSPIAPEVPIPHLPRGGRIAAIGIVATTVLLLVASYLDWSLGLPTALAGAATALAVVIREQKTPWTTLRHISWSVLPLVAGLFVIVQALDHAGLIGMLRSLLQGVAQQSAASAAWASGIAVALASNLLNNLPVGLIAGTTVQAADFPPEVARAVLIGVDLGPNLSMTGSLATILWLIALRRDGHGISALAFLRIGAIVMPPALLAALAASLIF
jgi:arsenical pump membrane protein